MDTTRIASERAAAWLRLERIAQDAGDSLEGFLAAHVLPAREGETLDQRRAEAGRLAGIAGEVLGDREVAMLRAEAGLREAVAAARKARRGHKRA
jgi:hypothetical protein